jgi:hypothetical protein
MDERDERFEEFLRGFQPRMPRPLPTAFGPRRPWKWLATAAALILFSGIAAHHLWKKQTLRNAPPVLTAQPTAPPAGNPAQEVSLGRLTRLAMEDPARLDAALTQASRDLLPRFDRTDSTLSVLAKE